MFSPFVSSPCKEFSGFREETRLKVKAAESSSEEEVPLEESKWQPKMGASHFVTRVKFLCGYDFLGLGFFLP